MPRQPVQSWKDLAPSDLFHYLPDYGVLICAACQYAVQPGAIWRHLKDIHHLPQSRRRPYIEYTSRLKLKEPADVQSPHANDFPIPQLPAEKGWRCMASGCNYLCASTKRMENHWPAVHARKGERGIDWHPTLLQTFFRGKMLRYFAGHDKRGSRSKNILVKSCQMDKCDEIPALQNEQQKVSAQEYLQEKYHLDELDRELLRHYFDSSHKTFVANTETETAWIEVVPDLARDNKFLLQGLLACTALHMAHLNINERQKYYTIRGCYHQEAAIPEFNKAIENPTENNCDAIMAFGYLLVVYSLATDTEYRTNPLLIVNANSCPFSDQMILPRWLHFIRTGCDMLKDLWHRIETGRASVLANAWERNLDVNDEEKLSRLDFFLSIIPHDDTWSGQSTQIYRNAANTLAESFAFIDRARKVITISTWNILGTWPVRIEEGFFSLVSEKHPGALILLAHYCVILNRLDECWYFEGRPASLITSIVQALDERWHPYIQDAVNEVLGAASLVEAVM